MKNSRIRFAPLTFLLVILAWGNATVALAQTVKDTEAVKVDEFSIASLRLADVGAQHYIRVDLSNRHDPAFDDADREPANIRITFLPSGRVIPQTEIVKANSVFIAGFNRQVLQIVLTNAVTTKPSPGDNQVQVRFQTLHFLGSGATASPVTKTGVTGTGRIFDATNINELVDATTEALKNAVASAKTSEEKNIFAALNVTVPSGGGDTEGSGDIIINRNLQSLPFGQGLFDRLNFGLKLKKASEDKADPRHFETGLTFRKTFLVNRAKIEAVKDAIDRTTAGSLNLAPTTTVMTLKNGMQSNDPEQIINDLQKDFFRGLVFDNAVKFEGDVDGASIGNISNLLYDGQLQVTTVSRVIGNQTGFWNFRLIPVGFEAGYNLKNEDDPSNEKHSLARFKTGAVFNMFYQADNQNALLNRLDFEVQGVNRYLFKSESVFDETTQKANLIEKGNKYWLQADLKFLFGPRVQAGRVGFRASFRRGSLPPVYAFNKAFTFGIVFETSDPDTSREIKLK
ncbi:MAG: hypothetical protein LC803_11880 [Acidobacteria bacterium]|nr:hypothetical protein [Acidobacteriota bacterium]